MNAGKTQTSAGFTLLEVIVVLVITSLVTTILMQGLSVILDTKLRFARALTSLEVEGLQTSIISTPLKGLMPDYPDGNDTFVGNERRLRGLTLSPLQGIDGAPTRIALAIDFDVTENVTKLTYFELGYEPVELTKWPGNEGRFFYRGRFGDWANSWPPPGDEFVQAPRTVRIETGLERRSDLIIQVMAPHERPFRVQDTPLGPAQ